MQISERKEGQILVIIVSGRLDHDAAESFREYALRRINEGARSILVVLLQKVEPRLFCAAGLLVSSRDRRRGT